MTARALEVFEGGRAPRSWEELWGRDRWRQSELPHGDLVVTYGREAVLRFDGLVQPWLKEAAKRWARARLLSSASPRTLVAYLRELVVFSGWLSQRAEVTSPSAITRELLEDYMLYVCSEPWAQATRRRRLGTLRAFLEEQRDDGLAGLPRGAVIRGAELPRVEARPPKGIDKQVFDQLVDPERLALLSSEQHRTLILLLAYTGMRISSLVLLRRDALETGSDGHPYLRFQNVKLSREAVIPIGSALSEQLRRQEEHLRKTYPGGHGVVAPIAPSPGTSRLGQGRALPHRARLDRRDRPCLRPQGGHPRRQRRARDVGPSASVPAPPRDEHGQRGRAADGDQEAV